MKYSNNQTPNQNTRFNKNKPSPEISDNLDSRKNEEQGRIGDDVTHNRSEQHGKPQKYKK